jgi:drug/metabolite transporter (DMT)-like permease
MEEYSKLSLPFFPAFFRVNYLFACCVIFVRVALKIKKPQKIPLLVLVFFVVMVFFGLLCGQ